MLKSVSKTTKYQNICVLILFLTFTIPIISGYDLQCLGVDFLTAGNHIGVCTDPDYSTSESTDIIFGALDTLKIDSCIMTQKQDDCDNILMSFHSTSEYLNNLATNLLLYKDKTCPCIQSYAEEFHHCFDTIDHMKSYCDTFSDSDPTENPFYDDYSDDYDNAGTCAEAISKTCGVSADHQLSFEEAVACLMANAATLEEDCSSVISILLASVAEDCSSDMATYCPDSLDSGSPVSAIMCLVSHLPSMSSTCRTSLLSLAEKENIPCAYEASYYCSDEKDIEDILECLSQVPDKQLSPSCAAIMEGYDKCNEHDEHQEDNAKLIDTSSTSISSKLSKVQGLFDISKLSSTPKLRTDDMEEHRTLQHKPRPKTKPGPKSKTGPCWAGGLPGPHDSSRGDDDDEQGFYGAGAEDGDRPPGPPSLVFSIMVLGAIVGVVFVVGKKFYMKMYANNPSGLSSDGTPAAAVAMSAMKDMAYNPLPAYDIGGGSDGDK